ncbi:MAG: hypothetical protein B6244_06465 [Candidatus Cloacimonetes bacterium 4572_55]|nr:MAG: hypothetical protein B6244_06465 [Candidatus Cloacimonetes bacterium 4572_55]
MSQFNFSCSQCGAELRYEPGTSSLICPYCGHKNEVQKEEARIEEIDLREYLRKLRLNAPTHEIVTIQCSNCAAETTFDPKVTAADCPYCGTSLVFTKKNTNQILSPGSLLPFEINHKEAGKKYREWIQGLWWAPNSVKKRARQDSGIIGMYVPYWTYDSHTVSHYQGERGEDYYVTENYTEEVDGRSVTRSRRVKKIRWYRVSGTVRLFFDDVLVLASRSLPKKYADELEPWDLKNLVPYKDDYLRGFRSEAYHIDMDQGFDIAKEIMDGRIRIAIRRDIGGDHQRIRSVNTHHNSVTFKHILLPIWISSYHYGGKIYQFLVNARTGEVQGERPWSWIKITLAVLAAAITLFMIYYVMNM